MKRQNRSHLRSYSGIRKHNRKNMEKILKEESKSNNSNEENNSIVIKKRRQYVLSEKKKIIDQYYELKDKYSKKGNRYFTKILGVPYSCLLEWIKEKNL